MPDPAGPGAAATAATGDDAALRAKLAGHSSDTKTGYFAGGGVATGAGANRVGVA